MAGSVVSTWVITHCFKTVSLHRSCLDDLVNYTKCLQEEYEHGRMDKMVKGFFYRHVTFFKAKTLTTKIPNGIHQTRTFYAVIRTGS
jgi:hypothetical protein